ncbi:11639_t:CDS:1, partial [Racocetra fulgida]
NDSKYESEFNGAGIHGILDKLVCIEANYFLSGPMGCARLDSSFTRAIREKRSLYRHTKRDMFNVVATW